MKKSGLAFILSATMVLAGMPSNVLTGFAEEVLVETATEEIYSEDSMDEAVTQMEENEAPDTADLPEEIETTLETNAVNVMEGESETAEMDIEHCSDLEDSFLENNEADEIVVDDFLENVEIMEVEETAETAEYTSGGSSYSEAEEMELGVSYDVTTLDEDTYVYFKYVPSNDGIYTFSSDGDIDTYGYLYDNDKIMLAKDDDNGVGYNFSFAYRLKKDSTYYLVVNTYSETTATFTVQVTEGGLFAEPETATEFDVEIGTSVTMSVDAEAETTISYQWSRYIDGWVDVNGANEKGLTVSLMSLAEQYRCLVTDKEGREKAIYFDLRGISHLVAEGYEYDVVVPAGTEKDLTVSASTSAALGPLTYQWYIETEEDGQIVQGAVSNTLHISVTKKQVYYCIISDKYDSISVYFYVNVGADSGVLTSGTNQIAVGTANVYSSYRFVPAATGQYEICVTSAGKCPNLRIYDVHGENKGSAYGWIDDEDSSIYYAYSYPNLVAGETYYFSVGLANGAVGNCQMSINLRHTHTSNVKSIVNPTCTTKGKATYVCIECEEEYSQVLPALGHSYGEYVVTKPATVLADGIKTRTCTRCGAQETAPLAKLAPTISVNATSIPLKVKQSTTKIKVTMGAGDYITSWKSNKPKIAKVNSSGKITGVKKGTAKITVTLASGLSKTITVKVQKTKVKTKKITNVSKKVTLKKKGKYTLAPTITPITTLEKVTYSTSNKKIATVSKKGVITAKKKGKAKITVKCGTKKKTITVTVK